MFTSSDKSVFAIICVYVMRYVRVCYYLCLRQAISPCLLLFVLCHAISPCLLLFVFTSCDKSVFAIFVFMSCDKSVFAFICVYVKR